MRGLVRSARRSRNALVVGDAYRPSAYDDDGWRATQTGLAISPVGRARSGRRLHPRIDWAAGLACQHRGLSLCICSRAAFIAALSSLQYSQPGSEQYGDPTSSEDSSETLARNGLIGHAA